MRDTTSPTKRRLKTAFPLLRKRKRKSAVLTADFLIIQALKHAAASDDGKLPTVKSGDMPDFPGRTWVAANDAVRTQGCGFDIANVSGLTHLFRMYDLRTLVADNPSVKAKGIKQLELTGHHGLTRCASPYDCLTEIELIRRGRAPAYQPQF